MKFLNFKFYRNGFIIFLLVILASRSSLFIQDRSYKEKLLTLEEENAELLSELDEYKNSNIDLISNEASLNDQINSLVLKLRLMETEVGSPLYLDEFELYLLNSMGITDVSEIPKDLLSHKEVIVTDGVLGGVMGFENIYLLNSQYVYATISDGHILGFGIYKYEVDENKNFIWESVYEVIF